MRLSDAFGQIALIRQQVARVEMFRGDRAGTTAFSGVIAVFGLGQFMAAGLLWLQAGRGHEA